MYRLTSHVVLCLIFLVNTAVADRDIVLLGGNADKVVINDEYGTIHITDGDPNTFVFECFDDVTEEPANIEFIGLSGTPSGTITVSILPGEGHTYGAASIWEVDLTDGNVTGQIEEIYISANLATTGDALCDNVTGDVYIAGHCVSAHGRRERARQITRAANQRISSVHEVFTRCGGVRRGL